MFLLDPSTFLTYGQAAEYLRISDRSLRRLVASGAITVVRIGGQVWFPPEHLHSFIARCTVQCATEHSA